MAIELQDHVREGKQGSAMTAGTSRKQQVVELLKSIETGDEAPLAAINPHTYIQHNLDAADGLNGLTAFLQALPPGSARVNTVRVFGDGDFVFAHTEYDLFGPQIGFDVYRFDDGLIVEHWDNLQETAGPNPSGRTMTDGPTEARNLDQTEATRALVRSFARDILVGRRLELLPQYYDGEHLIQHNPQFGDGVAGMRIAFAGPATQDSPFRLDHVHTVLAEGNFGLIITEGAVNGQPMAFYDLYRVENGKIAEHWDVIAPIPLRDTWKNGNGKFSF